MDVCLSPGWSYMVEHEEYAKHYVKYAEQEEVHFFTSFMGGPY